MGRGGRAGSGLALGLTNGILVQIVGINAFIVTLGTLTAVRGLVLLLTNGNSIDATSTALSPLSGPGPALNPQLLAVVAGLLTVGGGVWAARGRLRAERAPISAAHVLMIAGGAALAVAGKFLFATSWTLTTPVYLLASFTAAAWAVLRFTVAGRRLYATGGNAEAARLSGIAVNGYKIAAFALSGLAAASVGIIYAGKFNAINPNALTGTELTVLAAAILGGTSLFGGSGSVVKSVIGALILYTLSNGFNILNLGANYRA